LARFQQVLYIDEGRLRSAALAGLRSAPAANLQKRSYTYHWNPALKVCAFEPVPEIYHALMKNLALNNLLQRVDAHQLALAGQSGNAVFYLPASQSRDCEATGTLVGNSWQRRQGSPTLQVETVSFDDFERQYPCKLDLVKIDVEDFEADVLAGMKHTIRRDQPFIVCEILPRSHRNERTRENVASLGYTPYWITASGYIRVSRFDFERTGAHDFLLSPVAVSGEVLTDLQPLWDLKLLAENQSARGAVV
jgi:FkbM family methyltransferase